MTMKAAVLLLLTTLPLVVGRLGELQEGEGDVGAKASGNEAFFATNEIVPMFRSEEDNANDFLVDWDDKNVPFELVSLDEFDTFDASVSTTVRDSRELESVTSVRITNKCGSQAVWLAIIYTEEASGTLVHKGWYNLPSFQHVTFDDVVGGTYAVYAVSHDFRFEWDETAAAATHCFNNRCYKDYSASGSNSFQNLYCNSAGPSPTPSPVASPTPPPVTVTGRQKQWVDSHNTRRATIHGQFGKSFKPVQWSSQLASSAQGYADLLATVTTSTCYIAHGYQGNSFGGENIAANWGNSNYDFESPDSVLTRWFEDEAGLSYPANGHYTQVAWRGTGYVGCGEARKQYDGNKYCKIQVCRYLAPGNCNVPSNAGSSELNEIMMDSYSPCGPQSPTS